MWFLCIQIALFVAGAYALIAGKLPLMGNIKLEGKRARITGGILLLPAAVPVCYGIGFAIIAIATGHTQDVKPNASALDEPAMLGAIALVIIYVFLSRPRHKGAD